MTAPKAPRTLTVKLPPLHAGQKPIAESAARFRVASCGRRFGKTRLAQREGVRVALEGGRVWWIAPSYNVASSSWRDLRALVRQIPGVAIREADRELQFPTGGTVRVRSADQPDSLRGDSLDLAILDEAAFMAESVWTEAIRPTLSDRRGRALFLSTPRGRNWFWRAYQRGLDPTETEWASFSLPTAANPFIPEGEIEAARHSVPERVFRQEYEAQFSDDAGDVFRGVRDAATAERIGRALPGRRYVMGIDWGKSDDFTVVTVFDRAAGTMVAFDRFNQIDYAVQRGRVLALADRFQPSTVIAEANSIGVPIIEQLQRDGLPVQPFTTSNASKAEIVDALALAFEQRTIRILPEPALLAELEAFEMERLPSGLLRYAAPEGMHDDCVISLALAWLAVTGPRGDQNRGWVEIIEQAASRATAAAAPEPPRSATLPPDVYPEEIPTPCESDATPHRHDRVGGECLTPEGHLIVRGCPRLAPGQPWPDSYAVQGPAWEAALASSGLANGPRGPLPRSNPITFLNGEAVLAQMRAGFLRFGGGGSR